MSLVIGSLMVLLVAGAILYPFFRQRDRDGVDEEGSAEAELGYRWEGVRAGLLDAEMEREQGTLSEPEYQRARRQLMSEAAALLRQADLERRRERELLQGLEEAVRRERERRFGGPQTGKGKDQPPTGEPRNG